MCSGTAELIMNDATRAYAWDALDYDLNDSSRWSDRPELCRGKGDVYASPVVRNIRLSEPAHLARAE